MVKLNATSCGRTLHKGLAKMPVEIFGLRSFAPVRIRRLEFVDSNS
jgi:hypothetical protein